MNAKPVRTRPTPADSGSRLMANPEQLIVGTPQPPAAESLPPEPTVAPAPPAEPEPPVSATSDVDETDQPVEPEPSPVEPEPTPAPKPKPPRKAVAKSAAPPVEEPAEQGGKEQLTVRVGKNVLGRARAVVMFTSPFGGPLSLAELVEQAIEREIQRCADEYNGGEPFQPYKGRMRTGTLGR